MGKNVKGIKAVTNMVATLGVELIREDLVKANPKAVRDLANELYKLHLDAKRIAKTYLATGRAEKKAEWEQGKAERLQTRLDRFVLQAAKLGVDENEEFLAFIAEKNVDGAKKFVDAAKAKAKEKADALQAKLKAVAPKKVKAKAKPGPRVSSNGLTATVDRDAGWMAKDETIAAEIAVDPEIGIEPELEAAV
jgi:hypothetical protein